MSELSDSEKQLLAREVAADGFDPPLVADVADLLRMPRDSFIAGWEAAMEYRRQQGDGNLPDAVDDAVDDALVAVLGKPTRWQDFVETLTVERC